MKKVLFVGGGSIGHIAPAVAVASALKEERNNIEMHFVCSTKEDDSVFLVNEGFENVTQLDAPRTSLTFPWRFWRSYVQSKKILKRIQPSVVFSKGGYVSVPICLAAKRMNIPIILHDSDVVNGYANRLVARWAAHICTGFPSKPATSNQQPATFVGNPIRTTIAQGSADEGFRIAHLEGRSKPVLLIIGGSQGAQSLNEFVVNHIDELLNTFDVIHITGSGKKGVTKDRDGYWQTDLVGPELSHLYAATDIAVSRAGANTIAELAANEIPTILIPLRGAAHDHQQKNAEVIEQAGGCVIVQQKNMEKNLITTLKQLNDNSDRRKALKQALGKMHKPDAARQIAQILSKYLA